MPRAWIDAHCHLSDPRLVADVEGVVARSREAGVIGWILGGVDPDDWARQEELKRRLGGSVWLVFGLHPWRVAEWGEERVRAALERLEKRHGSAVAIGELGLDASPKRGGEQGLAAQRPAFERQLALARRSRKPVVLHIVGAHEQALGALEREGVLPAGGIVHSFSGDARVAERYRKLGLLLSIGTAVTRPGHRALKQALAALPREAFVVETDAPDQPPAGSPAGSGHEPSSLPLVADAIGRLRGESGEAILDRSAERLRQLFGREEG